MKTSDFVEFAPGKRTNILIAMTGGTIASQIDATGHLSVAELRSSLPPALSRATGRAKLQFDASFSFASIATLLSENLNPHDWVSMSQDVTRIVSEHKGVTDGIVILHGTDTMTFTASALSYLLAELPIPVVMTGSMWSADDPASDAAGNLYSAIQIAASNLPPQVYVVFPSASGRHDVYLGSRISSVRSYGLSFMGQPQDGIGYVGEAQVRIKAKSALAIGAKRRPLAESGCEVALDSAGIKLLPVFPGLDASDVIRYVDHATRALILHLYHSGTASVRDTRHGEYSIASAVRACCERGVHVFGMPCERMALQLPLYSTTKELLSSGMTPLPPMSLEAAFTKASLLDIRGLRGEEFKECVLESYVGEVFRPEELSFLTR